MRQRPVSLLVILIFLFIAVFCFPFAAADNEPTEAQISSIVQRDYPDRQIFDYAPIGEGKTEYIVLSKDVTDRSFVMIVNIEQPDIGVEFCNDLIMDGIPLDKEKVQIMDHLADGNPYVWYANTGSPDMMYVVFHKNENDRWAVTEAQFGDDWNDFYSFMYDMDDQMIHIFLTGNDLTAIPDDIINRDAETFNPAEVRLLLRDMVEPYL